MFSCVVWWVLLGSLIGTLTSWVLGNILNSKVDNTKYIDKISLLEKENKEIPRLRTEIRSLKKSQPKLEHRVELGEKNDLIIDLKERLSTLLTKFERASHVLNEKNEQINFLRPPQIDIKKANSLGLNLKSNDDFEVIEGIGPVISILLNQNGIHTFYDLSRTHPDYLREILAEAGPNFRMLNPTSWPEQACLAANNSWHALMAYQNQITKGGLKVSNWE